MIAFHKKLLLSLFPKSLAQKTNISENLSSTRYCNIWAILTIYGFACWTTNVSKINWYGNR